MSKKATDKSFAFGKNLHQVRILYPYLTMAESFCLASLETTIDGFSGPVLGSDELLDRTLGKIRVREVPAKYLGTGLSQVEIESVLEDAMSTPRFD